jgi:hypothetical protein
VYSSFIFPSLWLDYIFVLTFYVGICAFYVGKASQIIQEFQNCE